MRTIRRSAIVYMISMMFMMSAYAASQVTNVNVTHDGGGRTFITWSEKMESDTFSYRIYRSTQTITSSSIAEATLIAQVNRNGTANADIRETAEGGEHNWVIRDGEGELPDGTGLYVYSPGTSGEYYYAVTYVENGIENQNDFSNDNAVGPISETVGDGKPVLQRSYIGSTGREHRIYTFWPSSAQSNDSQFAYPFRVVLPNDYSADITYPLHVVFGGYSTTYMDGDYTFSNPDGEIIAYLEARTPYYQWLSGALTDWFIGYRDNLGSDEPASLGTVRWYGMERTRYIVNELLNGLGGVRVDSNRVIGYGGSQGGMATVFTAIYYPEIWAAVTSLVPVLNIYQECAYDMDELYESYGITSCFEVDYEFLRSTGIPQDDNWTLNTFSVLYGMPEDRLLTQDGESVWDSLDAATALSRLVERGESLPPLQIQASWNDGVLRWDEDHLAFIDALESSNSPYYLYWGDEAHEVQDPPAGNNSMTMMSLDRPTLGLSSYNRNDNALPPAYPDYNGGYGSGEYNGWIDGNGILHGHVAVDYRSISEFISGEDVVFQATLYANASDADGAMVNVTPLRTSVFKPAWGASVYWENYSGTALDLQTGTSALLQSGNQIADQYGRVTIPSVHVSPSGNTLVVTAVKDPSSDTDLTAVDNDGDGQTELAGDCNDTDPTIYSGAVDYCNDSIDSNCWDGDTDCTVVVDDEGGDEGGDEGEDEDGDEGGTETEIETEIIDTTNSAEADQDDTEQTDTPEEESDSHAVDDVDSEEPEDNSIVTDATDGEGAPVTGTTTILDGDRNSQPTEPLASGIGGGCALALSY